MTNYTKTMMESLAEVRGLQEDNMDLMRKAAKGAMQTIKFKDGKLKMDSFTASGIMGVYDKVNTKNKKAIENIINKGSKEQVLKLQSLAMKASGGASAGWKLPTKEETELDEGKEKDARQLVNPNKEVMIVKKSKVIVIDKKDQDKYLKQGWTLAEEDESEKKYKVTNDKLGVWTGSARSEEDAKEQALSGWGVVGNVEYARNTTVELIEEVELDEGRMKELHGYIAQGMSAKEIAKKMKLDVKTIEALMAGYGEAYELGTDEYREYLEKLTPGEKREVEEASARADAMRAMRRSKKVDPADVDTSASDDDVKAASKHIIMQMRKVISLKGDFKVEFGDKKKVKIPVKIAQTVIQKYNKLKKPADKEKFQNQVAKSHRDMLTVLKAGYMAAAYESTYTILERIDKKIKEIREGTKNG